jgi:hypothetical protein
MFAKKDYFGRSRHGNLHRHIRKAQKNAFGLKKWTF